MTMKKSVYPLSNNPLINALLTSTDFGQLITGADKQHPVNRCNAINNRFRCQFIDREAIKRIRISL